MKTVVDQNCLGRPEMRAYLEAYKENEAVVTDMAIFEMLKGSDATWEAKRRLEIVSDFPDSRGKDGSSEERGAFLSLPYFDPWRCIPSRLHSALPRGESVAQGVKAFDAEVTVIEPPHLRGRVW